MQSLCLLVSLSLLHTRWQVIDSQPTTALHSETETELTRIDYAEVAANGQRKWGDNKRRQKQASIPSAILLPLITSEIQRVV